FGRSMAAAAGSFTLTGIDAALTAARSMAAAAGSFTLTGIAAAFPLARTLLAEAGAFAWGGGAAVLTIPQTVISPYLKARYKAATLAVNRVRAASLFRRRSVEPGLTKTRARDPSLGD